MKSATIYVRKIGTGEIIHQIPVPLPCSEGKHERLLMGLLRNMDIENFYVDDDEIEDARAGKY